MRASVSDCVNFTPRAFPAGPSGSLTFFDLNNYWLHYYSII